MAWKCPKRNLIVDVGIDDASEEENKDADETPFEFGTFNADDLEADKEDTSLLSVVRRILAAPNRKQKIGGAPQSSKR